MWVCSTLGFYSISYRHGLYNIRGRARQDLLNLKEAAGLSAEVLYLPHADYQYRLVVDKAAFGMAMAALARTVTYPNFKDEIKHTPDQRDKEHAYMRVWGTMLGWGERVNGGRLVDRGYGEMERGWGGRMEEPPF